ncbi:hypothetical protein H311_02557 [Anncaliia algerae PRA109]|nr:hypothetical protein H311_02557 [Anncaliia algerae PRA109]
MCHNYTFLSSDNMNTKAVESFNNIFKQEVKSRNGIETSKRKQFLKDVCFCWDFGMMDFN